MAIAKPALPVLDRSHPVSNGIISAWPMYDATSETIHDIGGRGYDGFQNGGASNLISGTWGKCLDPTTLTDVEVPSESELSFGDSGTDREGSFLVLCKVNNNVAFYQILSKSDGGTREWECFINSSGNVVQFLIFDSGSDSVRIGRNSSNDVLTVGEWKVLVGTYDGSAVSGGINIWVDGVQVDSVDSKSGSYSGTTTKAVSMCMGHRNSLADFEGEIANTVFWDRKLTEEEIRLLSHNPYLMYQQPDMMEWLGGTITGGGTSVPVFINHFKNQGQL